MEDKRPSRPPLAYTAPTTERRLKQLPQQPMPSRNLFNPASDLIVIVAVSLSVLEALECEKHPTPMETLRSISSSRLVLQWIPADCGIQVNEKVD